MISVASRVVSATLDILRSCGAGRRECMVYWTAAGARDEVSAVVHPTHVATRGSCEIDGAWATEFFLELAAHHEHVVVQIHTHPGVFVAHSATDDAHVLVPVPGFVSIVVPDFANRDSLAGWGIWQLNAGGAWRAAPEVLEWRND